MDFNHDQPLDRGAAASERSALASALVDGHADALFRYARQRVVDDATAEDLVHETFVAALQGFERFEERSAPRTCLIGILSAHDRRSLATHRPNRDQFGR